MSVYRPRNSPFFHFDFWLDGRRFVGSTRSTEIRQARAVERLKRDAARAALKVEAAPVDAMTVDVAVGRFYAEVGQYYADPKTLYGYLDRLAEFFGRTTRLDAIGDDDVAKLVAWRRGQVGHAGRRRAKGAAAPAKVSAATVNRSTVELLRTVFGRARRAWGARFLHEPVWRRHLLPEPQERVRELHDGEAAAIEDAIRDDYRPFFAFVRASGLRLNECLLKWSEVNWGAGQIIKTGKGERRIVVPLTPTIREILAPLRGHHPEAVFTYIARKSRGTCKKGRRYALTREGVKTRWRRDRKASGVTDFRFHDFRHDLGTKLLRLTGNLKLVQQALNHADIATTTRYAHVLTEEVAAGLERVSESRRKSRRAVRKVG